MSLTPIPAMPIPAMTPIPAPIPAENALTSTSGSETDRLIESVRHGRGEELDHGAHARRQVAALSEK